MLILLRNLMKLLATFLKEILTSEDSSVSLHGLLHGESNFSSRLGALRVSNSIEVRNSLLSSSLRKLFLSLTRLESLNGSVGGSSTEDDEIKERVSTKSVCTMD